MNGTATVEDNQDWRTDAIALKTYYKITVVKTVW